MKDDESCAFMATTGGTIIADGSITDGYKTVARSETGGMISLIDSKHSRADAIKYIDSAKAMIINSKELDQDEMNEIIALLDDLKSQNNESALDTANKILTLASTAVTFYHGIESSISRFLEIINNLGS